MYLEIDLCLEKKMYWLRIFSNEVIIDSTAYSIGFYLLQIAPK